MEYFVGLDASLDTVNICIVDQDGSVLLKQKVDAEPQQIVALLKRFGRPLKRIGLEAGPTSSWLFSELRAAGYPALCLECRHVKAGLSAMRNKTDRNDARGLAHLVRLGWFRQVHVKSEAAQEIRMLLVNRNLLLSKLQISRTRFVFAPHGAEFVVRFVPREHRNLIGAPQRGFGGEALEVAARLVLRSHPMKLALLIVCLLGVILGLGMNGMSFMGEPHTPGSIQQAIFSNLSRR